MRFWIAKLVVIEVERVTIIAMVRCLQRWEKALSLGSLGMGMGKEEMG